MWLQQGNSEGFNNYFWWENKVLIFIFGGKKGLSTFCISDDGIASQFSSSLAVTLYYKTECSFTANVNLLC